MSYLVLARKWRPKRFAELVGQEHVVRALTNALDSGRVHHALLFSGTRGIGKTTIARIFAKSMNCERGQGAEPCGECASCLDIDAGRFVDLLEIDAASNTSVDNVREVIENAQYMPSRGRTKVYLIDEVHMLSKQAFNALLKTLEEPPPHVKFLLATTDPDKLPVTVLSRCLQFNLKRLDLEQIAGQMRHILAAEQLPIDEGAIALLARGADGSLRDGLSLLDQAIAYTASALDEAGVRTMLGSVDRARIGALLDALAAGNGAALMDEVGTLAGFASDFAQVLDELAATLHRIQLRQLVPDLDTGADTEEADVGIAALAAQLAPELVQLWYQMAIGGRRDLSLAPTPRTGFEMALLRMLAFRPASGGSDSPGVDASVSRQPAAPRPAASKPAAKPMGQAASSRVAEPPMPAPTPARRAPVAPDRDAMAPGAAAPAHSSASAKPAVAAHAGRNPIQPPRSDVALAGNADWLALLDTAGLRGPVRELAAHAAFCAYAGGELRLALPEALSHLRTDALTAGLADALASSLGVAPRIVFVADAAAGAGETLHARNARQHDERQAGAEQSFLADSAVQRYMQQYGAKLVPGSIRPGDDA
jgi:DNA polymerase-3 subunit gamma/tau